VVTLPSGNHQKTPLCAIACQNIMNEVLKENNLPEGISSVLVADHEMGRNW
jgi:aldehyde dehydrogenase (NAD+)